MTICLDKRAPSPVSSTLASVRDLTSPARPQGLSQASDTELVGLIRDGQTDALSELYERYSSYLLALARRVLPDAEDAFDVVQEVLLYVWRRADYYDSTRATVKTWLTMATRCRAIDRFRGSRIRNQRQYTYALAEPRHENARAYGQSLGTERVRRVGQALEVLPPAQRRALELAYYEGLSQSEIAAHEGLPLGTVKTRIFQGLRRLRRDLSSEITDLI